MLYGKINHQQKSYCCHLMQAPCCLLSSSLCSRTISWFNYNFRVLLSSSFSKSGAWRMWGVSVMQTVLNPKLCHCYSDSIVVLTNNQNSTCNSAHFTVEAVRAELLMDPQQVCGRAKVCWISASLQDIAYPFPCSWVCCTWKPSITHSVLKNHPSHLAAEELQER